MSQSLKTMGKRFALRFTRGRVGNWILQRAVMMFAPKHRIGVNLVCLDELGRVLLLYHVFHPSVPWGLPGGWLDHGESPQACALRELKEETGLVAQIEHNLLIVEQKRPPHIGIVFFAKIDSKKQTLNTLSGEILEARWFEPDELPPRLTRTTREAISAATEYHAAEQTNSQSQFKQRI